MGTPTSIAIAKQGSRTGGRDGVEGTENKNHRQLTGNQRFLLIGKQVPGRRFRGMKCRSSSASRGSERDRISRGLPHGDKRCRKSPSCNPISSGFPTNATVALDRAWFRSSGPASQKIVARHPPCVRRRCRSRIRRVQESASFENSPLLRSRIRRARDEILPHDHRAARG